MSQPTIIDDTNSNIVYTPPSAWYSPPTPNTQNGSYNGTHHEGYVNGTVTLRFRGKKVSAFLIPDGGVGWTYKFDDKTGGPFYSGPISGAQPVTTNNLTLEADAEGDHTLSLHHELFKGPSGDPTAGLLWVDYFSIDGQLLDPSGAVVAASTTASATPSSLPSYTPAPNNVAVPVGAGLSVGFFALFSVAGFFYMRRRQQAAQNAAKV